MTAVPGAARPGTETPSPAPRQPYQLHGQAPRFRFTALDGLRAIAVLLALLTTLSETVARVNPSDGIRYVFDGGFAGIDLIFVISGFLIGRRLVEASGQGLLPVGWLLRRFAPLHVFALVIAFGWVAWAWLAPVVRGDLTPSDTSITGTPSQWLTSAALLSGFIDPGPAGYPLAWVLSVGFWIGALLIVLTAVLSGGFTLATRIGPFGRASRFGRPERIDSPDPGRPALLTALIASGAGIAVLLTSSDAATAGQAGGNQNGLLGTGQGLLGLGLGMLTYLVLRARTGILTRPTDKLHPRRQVPAGIGAGVFLAALLVCVDRSDLVLERHLLPVFPISAALVYFLARADGRSLLHRALEARPAQWLGRRALAFFILQGPVLISVQQISAHAHPDLDTDLVNLCVVIEAVLGSLIVAELGYRFVERLLAARPPAVLMPVRAAGPTDRDLDDEDEDAESDPLPIVGAIGRVPSTRASLGIPETPGIRRAATDNAVATTAVPPSPEAPAGPAAPATPAGLAVPEGPAVPEARTIEETPAVPVATAKPRSGRRAAGSPEGTVELVAGTAEPVAGTAKPSTVGMTWPAAAGGIDSIAPARTGGAGLATPATSAARTSAAGTQAAGTSEAGLVRSELRLRPLPRKAAPPAGVTAAEKSVEALKKAVGSPRKPVGGAKQPPATGEPGQAQKKATEAPRKAVPVAKKAAVPNRTADVANRTAAVPNRTADVPNRTADVPTTTDDAPNKTVDVRKRTVDVRRDDAGGNTVDLTPNTDTARVTPMTDDADPIRTPDEADTDSPQP